MIFSSGFKEVYPDLSLNEKSLRMELLPNDSEASRRVKLTGTCSENASIPFSPCRFTVPGVGGKTKEFIARDQIDAANELNESLVRTRNERYCFDGDILDGFSESHFLSFPFGPLSLGLVSSFSTTIAEYENLGK